MSERTAFRLAVLAALAMLGVGVFMGVTAAPCRPLPMSALTAFELVRSVEDLQRIFGVAGDVCRAPITAQLDHANLLDTIAYIPAYAAFYALVLFGLGKRDATLGWTAVTITLICALADWIENAAMFELSAAPDAPADWLPTLIAATNLKWVGLAVATTLGGVMLWRRGGLGWLGLIACAVPLPVSIWALISPDAAGQYLIPGMAVASLMLLAVAVWGSFGKVAAAQVTG
jgi:hypothetical protein